MHGRHACFSPATCAHVDLWFCETIHRNYAESDLLYCAPQLCQLCNENPDILLLKVDFDENRDIVKPLAIRVRLPGVTGMLQS